MNETLELLSKHRSIREYADEPIPEAHIRAAVASGQAASTSSAVQAATIIQVTRDEERERLVALTGGQDKVARCGAFFVVCGDSRRHRLICARDGTEYDARMEAFLVTVIDASLFAQNVVIAFESMGYGVCYVGGLRNQLEAVGSLLSIPEGVYPLYGLCVGVPAESPLPRPRLPIEGVFFKDRYGSDAAVLAAVADYDAAYVPYMRARLGKDRDWSGSMRRKFEAPQRPGVARFYRSQGADLS